MVALYVTKEWLESLPVVSELIIFKERGDKYYSLLAGRKTIVEGPFVRAELARRELTKKDNLFIPCLIPTGVIAGAFDLTDEEAQGYGFKVRKDKG